MSIPTPETSLPPLSGGPGMTQDGQNSGDAVLTFSIVAGLAASNDDWYEIPVIGKIARQSAGL